LPFRRHRFPYLTVWPQDGFHDPAHGGENPSLQVAVGIRPAPGSWRTCGQLVSNLSLRGSIGRKNLSTFSNTRPQTVGTDEENIVNVVESMSYINRPNGSQSCSGEPFALHSGWVGIVSGIASPSGEITRRVAWVCLSAFSGWDMSGQYRPPASLPWDTK
jgi:hypothetical protein